MPADLTALDLSKPTAHDRATVYRELLARLSAVLPKAAVESSRLQSDAFLEQVEQFRRGVADSAEDTSASAFPQVCDDYFTRARAYLLEREHEYVELIEVLRSTVGRLSGDADAFHGELLDVSARLNGLIEMDDIRQIRERMAQEAVRLKAASEQQRRQEEKTLSRLTRRIETLQASLNEAQTQASTDPLTGVANRGHFDQMVQRWMHTFERAGEPFVLGLLDIDDFKRINDTHGHPIGDRVILCAAQWLRASVRGTDFVARYGGEEFAVLLSHSSAAQAEARLADVLKSVADRRFDYDGGTETRSVSFTLSAGVAEAAPGDTVESLVRRADQSLYQAKRAGKNRVVVHRPSRLSNLFR